MNENPPDERSWAIALLRDGFTRVHEGIEGLLAEADPRMLGFRTGENSNSAAWLLWHLTRVQDDHFADLVHALDPGSSTEQRWIDNDWVSRFDLPYSRLDTGYGHNSEQVAAIGMPGTGNLRGYHQDVHEETLKVLGSLSEADLGVVIDTHWDPAVTVAMRLISVLGDTTSHLGQAEFLRGVYADLGH